MNFLFPETIRNMWRATAGSWWTESSVSPIWTIPVYVPCDVESLASKFHEIYQAEAKRQGDVRHKDAYTDLPENIKEFDRVLARYVLLNFVPLAQGAEK